MIHRIPVFIPTRKPSNQSLRLMYLGKDKPTEKESPPFRTYNSTLLTPSFHASYSIIILSVILAFIAFAASWPMAIIIAATILFLISSRFLIYHFKRFTRVELYDQSVVLSGMLNHIEISYKDIERLHPQRDNQRLRIETKNGESVQISYLKFEVNRLVYHLEKAVYGQTI